MRAPPTPPPLRPAPAPAANRRPPPFPPLPRTPPSPQVLTSQGLATFTLADCVQTLLRETFEVLAPHHLAALQQQVAEGGGAGGAQATLDAQRAAAVRLAR
jgi:hypothetical protein